MRKQLQRLPARCDWLRSACGAPRRAALLLSMSDACDANTLLPADLSCRTAHVPRAQGNTGTSLPSPCIPSPQYGSAAAEALAAGKERAAQLAAVAAEKAKQVGRARGQREQGGETPCLLVCSHALCRTCSPGPKHAITSLLHGLARRWILPRFPQAAIQAAIKAGDAMRASGESLKVAGERAEAEAQSNGEEKAGEQARAAGEAEKSADGARQSEAGSGGGPSSSAGEREKVAVADPKGPRSKL